ncbi:MAG TPA: hypothetical protein VH639_06065 [Bryobacteraceae bacterium]
MRKVLVALLITFAAWVHNPAAAQGTGKPASGIPRMPDGKPNFTGVWAGPAFTHIVGPNDTDAPHITGFDRNKMSPLLPGVESIFRQPNNGDLRHDDPTALCLPDGHPREALAPYATQIVQTPDTVVILYEYMHFFRVIPIGKPHPDDVELTFMGDGVAKWDGDTLVIDTIGLKSWPISASNQWHSDALHTIERLHHVDATTVSYEITIDDPKIFTKPWSQQFQMKLHPTWRLLEQVCEENNRCEGGKCTDSDVQKGK